MLLAECIGYVAELLEGAVSDAETVPFLSLGWPTAEHPFLAYVHEDPESVTYSDESTSHVAMGGSVRGLYRVEFSVGVELLASTASPGDSASIVLDWYERLVTAVANDKTLGGLCVHAQPYFSSGATGFATDSRLAVNAVQCGVRVKAEFNPKKKE